MIQILLVDDHPSLMEGTKVLIEQEEDMKVFLAHSGKEALQISVLQDFDVMLIDLHMPDINGIELAKQILNVTPETIILIYTGFEYQDYFNLMVESGISGFILKTANKEQLVTAVRCALRGEVILPLSLVKQFRRVGDKESKTTIDHHKISNTEYEILKEVAKGKSNKEISETLLMSQRSLEYCLTHLFHKLHVKSRIEAVMMAKQMGVLSDFEDQPIPFASPLA